MCLSVHLSFHSMHFASVRYLNICIGISFKLCICICTNNVSHGIVNRQISLICHRVMALVNEQKNVFGLKFRYYLEYLDEISQK